MLILTLSTGQSVTIGETTLSILPGRSRGRNKNRVVVGIEAPREVPIARDNAKHRPEDQTAAEVPHPEQQEEWITFEEAVGRLVERFETADSTTLRAHAHALARLDRGLVISALIEVVAPVAEN